jgi:hypothetical protein
MLVKVHTRGNIVSLYSVHSLEFPLAPFHPSLRLLMGALTTPLLDMTKDEGRSDDGREREKERERERER